MSLRSTQKVFMTPLNILRKSSRKSSKKASRKSSKKASKKASNNSNILKFKIILRYSETHQKVIDFDYNNDSDNPSKIAKELVDEKIIPIIDKKDFKKSINKLIKNPTLYYTSFKSEIDDDYDDDEHMYVKYKRIGQKSRLPYAKKIPNGHIQIELVPKDESKIVIVDEYELTRPGNNIDKYSNSNQRKINLRHQQQLNNEQDTYKYAW